MNSLKERAQALLEGRLTALEGLENARQRAEQARHELRDAEAAITSAWNHATDAGWTPAELKKLGVNQPTTARRGGGGRTRRANPLTTRGAAVDD